MYASSGTLHFLLCLPHAHKAKFELASLPSESIPEISLFFSAHIMTVVYFHPSIYHTLSYTCDVCLFLLTVLPFDSNQSLSSWHKVDNDKC
jgi:hypothetical protein